MLSLVKYEYIKQFWTKRMMAVLIGFVIINLFNVYHTYRENGMFVYTTEVNQFENIYWDLYKDYSGKINIEKVRRLLDQLEKVETKIAYNTGSRRADDPEMLTGSAYLDKLLLSKGYIVPMEYFYTYHDWSNEIVKTSVDNIAFYEQYGNLYKVRESRSIASLFSNRSIENFAYLEMYDYYFYYDFSVFLVLLLCVYGSSGIYLTEKEVGFDRILKTSVNGGWKTRFAKWIAFILFMVIIAVFFFITEWIAFNVVFKNVNNFNMPIYSVHHFRYSPLELSLLKYCGLNVFVKWLGLITIGTCCITLSTLFKEVIPAFLSNLLLTIIALLHFDSIMGTNKVLLKAMNPLALLVNRTLFMKTEFVDVFGFPVLSYKISMLCAIALMGCNICFMYVCSKRNSI